MPRTPKLPTRQERREGRRQAREAKAQSRHAARQTPLQPDYAPVPPVKPMTAPVVPLNDAQRAYDRAIATSRIVFGVGPAGTGKTWFAAMRAAEALENGEIKKVYITRPAQEAGEEMGFLPGELDEKYEPYLRPVRDAFEEKFGTGHFEYLLKAKVIEPRPLGFLRGSTIKNAWILADEMQNATKAQMKMFLTRIGENSKFIVNGDPRQCDIAVSASGLVDAIRRTDRIAGVNTVTFTHEDVVRDGICQDIVVAYENDPAEI